MDLSWQLGVASVVAAIVLYEGVTRLLKRRRTVVASSTPMMQALPNVPKGTATAEIIQRVPIWSLDGESRPALEDSAGRARFLCECCGYPTGDQWGAQAVCLICDFEGALPVDPRFQIDAAERARLIIQARTNFRENGSAVAATERVPLSHAEARLRSQLRARYDYILAQLDPSDATERWNEIDHLTEQLRTTRTRLGQTD